MTRIVILGVALLAAPIVAQDPDAEPPVMFQGVKYDAWLRIAQEPKNRDTWQQELALRALRALRAMGKSDAETTKVIREGLESKKVLTRVAAAECAATLGPHDAAPELIALLNNPELCNHQSMQLPIVMALGQIGAPAAKAVPVLVKLVNGPADLLVRMGCIRLLAATGQGQEAAVVAMRGALQDPGR